MKKWKKFLTTVLTVWMIFGLTSISAMAEDDSYTYTVTFYVGAQGTFNGTAGLSETGEVTQTADKITVSGLKAGDIIGFNAQAGAVTLNESSKYYVKGVRLSGRDNNTIGESAFRVTEDADYVVAYGVKGDMVAYTVNYQDEAGNTLAPSNTYYGNIGDKPVVAYLYIENYTPQALGLTKTLSSNEAENVFTFVYTPVETGTTGTTGITGTAETTGTTGTTGTTDGTTAADGTAATTDANAADDGQDATVTSEDEEVPLGNQDIVDLDDEETPQSNIDLSQEDVKKGFPVAAGAAIGVAAIAALIVLILALKKHNKNNAQV